MLGLHHVQLAMPPGGEEKARTFFVDVLGMAEVQKPPVLAARGGAWFRLEQLEVHCGVEEDFEPAHKAHPGILTSDLDAIKARLTEAGYPVDEDDLFPGFRRFYSVDCFDNRLEFLEPESEAG